MEREREAHPLRTGIKPETYAICVADKLIQGFDTKNIKLGNTLSNDQLAHEHFDYCLANPPFGVKWEKVQKQVNDEHTNRDLRVASGRVCPASETVRCYS